MSPPSVGNLGGYSRALLRHLQRRGPQTREDLDGHFVFGRHCWYPETLDAAIAELVETGYMAVPDSHGYRLTLRSPL